MRRIEGYMTLAEAAATYGYSTRTLRYAITRGTLPAMMAGKLYLVTAEDMEAHAKRTGHAAGRPPRPPHAPHE
jgi:excisionase family DNA binding protein